MNAGGPDGQGWSLRGLIRPTQALRQLKVRFADDLLARRGRACHRHTAESTGRASMTTQKMTLALVESRVWGGHGWESDDDWVALAASAVIAFNGVSMLRRGQ